MLFSLLLGVTNGIVGSVPMIQAPSRVPEEHRELTGNIMTLSYNIGLTTGSLVAYLLDAILGPLIPNICSVRELPPSTVAALFTTDINATAVGEAATTLISPTVPATTNPISMVVSSTLGALLTQALGSTSVEPTAASFNVTTEILPVNITGPY